MRRMITPFTASVAARTRGAGHAVRTGPANQIPCPGMKRTLSRRRLLTRGAAAAAAGAGLAGQATPLLGQAPTVVTARRFKGWVTRGNGPGRTTLQVLTLRPIGGRQIVVRTEATNLCYSNVNFVLAL